MEVGKSFPKQDAVKGPSRSMFGVLNCFIIFFITFFRAVPEPFLDSLSQAPLPTAPVLVRWSKMQRRARARHGLLTRRLGFPCGV